jgi:hypothetical protein
MAHDIEEDFCDGSISKTPTSSSRSVSQSDHFQAVGAPKWLRPQQSRQYIYDTCVTIVLFSTKWNFVSRLVFYWSKLCSAPRCSDWYVAIHSSQLDTTVLTPNQGLRWVFRAGFVHREISSGNIILVTTDSEDHKRSCRTWSTQVQ